MVVRPDFCLPKGTFLVEPQGLVIKLPTGTILIGYIDPRFIRQKAPVRFIQIILFPELHRKVLYGDLLVYYVTILPSDGYLGVPDLSSISSQCVLLS